MCIYKLVWNEINAKELVPAQLSALMEMSLSFHSHLQTRALFSLLRVRFVWSVIAILYEQIEMKIYKE